MARLTLGEELVSQEHEIIHNSLPRYLKTYIKVTLQDGSEFICAPEDFGHMTEGIAGYQTEEV